MAASPASASPEGSVTTPRTVRRLLTAAALAAAMLSTDGLPDGEGVAEGPWSTAWGWASPAA